MGLLRVSRQMEIVRNLVRADLDAEPAKALLRTMLHTLDLMQRDVALFERKPAPPRCARHNGLAWPLGDEDQLKDRPRS